MNNEKQQEGWQHQESVDDNLIEGDDFDTEVIIYQGKPYPTINAYFALATKLGIDIDEVVEKESDTEWIIRARAGWFHKEEDGTITHEMHRWGGAADKKNDRHGYAKAWGKAQRNAFKGFLRGHPELTKATEAFMKKATAQQGLESPATPTPTPAPTPAPENSTENLTPRQKASNALAMRKEDLQQSHHMDTKILAAAILHHFGKTDMDEMLDSSWREIEILLNTMEVSVLKEWIEDMRQDTSET